MNKSITNLYKSNSTMQDNNNNNKLYSIPDLKQIKNCMEDIPEYREYIKLNNVFNYVELPQHKYMNSDEKPIYMSYNRQLNYWDADAVLNSFYKCSKEILNKTVNN